MQLQRKAGSSSGLSAPLAARQRGRFVVRNVAQRPNEGSAPTRTFRSDSTLPSVAPRSQQPLRQLASPWPEEQQRQQLHRAELSELQLPADSPLRKYFEWWDTLPSRYKIVLAGSLSFVICNMVSRR